MLPAPKILPRTGFDGRFCIVGTSGWGSRKKRFESEDKDRQFSERYYDLFERRTPVGVEIDQELSKGGKSAIAGKTLRKELKHRHMACAAPTPMMERLT